MLLRPFDFPSLLEVFFFTLAMVYLFFLTQKIGVKSDALKAGKQRFLAGKVEFFL